MTCFSRCVLVGLHTGAESVRFDFDEVAAHFPSPRAGEHVKGSSPYRWSAGSTNSMNSGFFSFSDGILSARNSSMGGGLNPLADPLPSTTNSNNPPPSSSKHKKAHRRSSEGQTNNNNATNNITTDQNVANDSINNTNSSGNRLQDAFQSPHNVSLPVNHGPTSTRSTRQRVRN